jgi:8-oxo-dGTP diphosphatase
VALIRVVAAVVSRGNRFLVCQRPLSKRHGGLWEFPGGKTEPGESDEAAARRELREELEVDLEHAYAPDFQVTDPGSEFLLAFVPVDIRGDPVCNEHIALHWGTPDELLALPLAPSDRRYVEFVMNRAAVDRP